MHKLQMREYVECFRKQFIFLGESRHRSKGKYYTAYNNEKGLSTDLGAMMVFINTAKHYGFNREQIISELQIKPGLFDELEDNLPMILKHDFEDKALHDFVRVKSGLVINLIRFNYRLKPPEKNFDLD